MQVLNKIPSTLHRFLVTTIDCTEQTQQRGPGTTERTPPPARLGLWPAGRRRSGRRWRWGRRPWALDAVAAPARVGRRQAGVSICITKLLSFKAPKVQPIGQRRLFYTSKTQRRDTGPPQELQGAFHNSLAKPSGPVRGGQLARSKNRFSAPSSVSYSHLLFFWDGWVLTPCQSSGDLSRNHLPAKTESFTFLIQSGDPVGRQASRPRAPGGGFLSRIQRTSRQACGPRAGHEKH